MPMFFFLSAYDYTNPQKSSLSIDIEDYRSALQNHWPDLKIINHPNPIYDLVWELNPYPEVSQWGLKCLLYGQQYVCCELNDAITWGINEYFSQSDTRFSFKIHNHGLFEYILWHRAYVHLKYPLFLMVSHSHDMSLELTASTTVIEIERYIVAASLPILNNE